MEAPDLSVLFCLSSALACFTSATSPPSPSGAGDRTLTGRFSDETMWYLIGGAAVAGPDIPQEIDLPGVIMTLHLQLAPLISLGAGIGILVFPKLLNYIVAGYLIVIGVLGLLGHPM